MLDVGDGAKVGLEKGSHGFFILLLSTHLEVQSYCKMRLAVQQVREVGNPV